MAAAVVTRKMFPQSHHLFAALLLDEDVKQDSGWLVGMAGEPLPNLVHRIGFCIPGRNALHAALVRLVAQIAGIGQRKISMKEATVAEMAALYGVHPSTITRSIRRLEKLKN